jgi:hypothetical protein
MKKPQKPRRPPDPQKYITNKYTIDTCLADSSFSELIAATKDFIKRVDGRDAEVSLDNLFLEDYGEFDNYTIELVYKDLKEKDEQEYKEELAKHKKDLETYEKKMLDYEKKLKKYYEFKMKDDLKK